MSGLYKFKHACQYRQRESKRMMDKLYPISHQSFQRLSEGSRRNLAMNLNSAVFRERFDYGKGVQLDVGISML